MALRPASAGAARAVEVSQPGLSSEATFRPQAIQPLESGPKLSARRSVTGSQQRRPFSAGLRPLGKILTAMVSRKPADSARPKPGRRNPRSGLSRPALQQSLAFRSTATSGSSRGLVRREFVATAHYAAARAQGKKASSVRNSSLGASTGQVRSPPTASRSASGYRARNPPARGRRW